MMRYTFLCLLVFCSTCLCISPKTTTSQECGKSLVVSREGSISSPGYPLGYPSHISCKWTIFYPENSSLSLRLVDMDIEEDPKCSAPPCCTHNWLSFSSTQICGTNVSVPEYTPHSKTVTSIKFHTSKALKGGRGFRIIYLVCKNDQFRCADNLKCIDSFMQCDGVPDCFDSSDEWHCNKEKKKLHIILDECSGENMLPCGGSDFGCYNNITERCNGIANCPNNGSDEINCGVCGPNMLYCRHGGCYPLSGACDDIVHCAGGWDEGKLGGCGICLTGHVPCGPNDRCHCYHANTQRCDGQIDCPGGDDEISCVIGCDDKIACASVQGCYSPSERCDGVSQCLDHSDEIGCLRSIAVKFECGSGKCIDKYLICNEEDDCGDGSDEANCIRNSVITLVVMGSLVCGLLPVLGVVILWRYYTSRYRPNSHSAHNIIQRQDDLEPSDDGSLYHMYREPPPSYQEAIMQGASPPPYWPSNRFTDVHVQSNLPPPPPSRRHRSRTSARNQTFDFPPKYHQVVKPLVEPVITNTHISEAVSENQIHSDSANGTEGDTVMLELSDNDANTSAVDRRESDSNFSAGTSQFHSRAFDIQENQDSN